MMTIIIIATKTYQVITVRHTLAVSFLVSCSMVKAMHAHSEPLFPAETLIFQAVWMLCAESPLGIWVTGCPWATLGPIPGQHLLRDWLGPSPPPRTAAKAFSAPELPVGWAGLPLQQLFSSTSPAPWPTSSHPYSIVSKRSISQSHSLIQAPSCLVIFFTNIGQELVACLVLLFATQYFQASCCKGGPPPLCLTPVLSLAPWSFPHIAWKTAAVHINIGMETMCEFPKFR